MKGDSPENIPKIVIENSPDSPQRGEENHNHNLNNNTNTTATNNNNNNNKSGVLKVIDAERGRARSIDFGKIFSSASNRNHGSERDSLLCSDDESSTKEKSKNKLVQKFNNMLRRGSDIPKADKVRAGSIDFSNAVPKNILSQCSPSVSKSDQLCVPTTERRGSLFVQPKGTIQHTVEANDTLASIAARYKSTVAELKALNRLMSTLLFPGKILFVPGEDYAKECRRPSEPFSDKLGVNKNPTKIKSLSRPCSPVVLGKLDEGTVYGERKPKKPTVFSGEAKYLTGGENNLKGLLTITASEVRFDPYNRLKGDEMVPDEINTIIGLVKYKMSTASILHSASFQVDDPFQRKSEIISDDQVGPQKAVFTIGDYHENIENEEVEKQANYLRLTLVRKSKQERPFVEALVKMCIPGPNYMDHYFVLKPKISQDLQEFLMIHFPDKLTSSDEHDNSLIRLTDVQAQVTKSNLRRKLSIAELCNLALPELSDPSHIFNDGHVRVLREFIPPKFDGRPWQLAYGTWKHGFLLKTLYRKMESFKREEVALIMIKSTCSEVFGGLLCGSLTKSESFCGTGESFLFTFSPSFQIYPWARKNECFARAGSDCFIMGSSEGALGLWIDEKLHHGSSNPCETFDNDTLTSDPNFVIYDLEVWTFPYELLPPCL